MADDDKSISVGISHKGWLSAVGFSALIMLLVAVGATDFLGSLTFIILGAVFGAVGLFLWMFPGSRFFVLVFANSLAIYTSVYAFLRLANFEGSAPWAIAVGYLLPIFVFLVAVALKRSEIQHLSRDEELLRENLSGRKLIWIAPIFVIAASTFALPRLSLDAETLSLVLVGSMGLVAIFVAGVSRQISLFLIDTGLLFDQFFVRTGRLFRPAFAFLTLYSFIVIVFAMIFRIMDRLATEPAFFVEGVRTTISFSDSLYFSLITMSTVGYGDITPAAEAVRVVAAIEVILGILLFLFGFAEIMRYVRETDGKNGAGK
ncbi:MAG: two pore domain potassium channel family protein [Rhodospirillaceae bacterium]|nr:two pore domain potassium channel family protein [Rhodospirillaceae bacterium]MBT3808102.1 two pore domain potassium channel family protein [Rhodospirillaceae bacterium]MBT3931498.1 two pore domain potassium channel family protein [Rhodospirillaceae bacterium]MBT4771978.1 two pore domain potassium channel family protein [Rhodospirillaceae bacterium]MBT5357281.1 two pore domain potassium channel family protein [Rhodospirillaceae bacterium]